LKTTIKITQAILLVFFTCITTCLMAQIQTQKIKMSYDAAGNRIKRQFVIETDNTYNPGRTSGGADSTLSNNSKPDSSQDLVSETVVNVYPNPINDLVNIDFTKGSENAQAILFIYDSNGRYISEYKIETGINTINLNFLNAGNYQFIVIADRYRQSWQVSKLN
jgi:hypothetical protein